MSEVKYIAKQNFYLGGGDRAREGKPVKNYSKKHIDKGLVVTEAEYKELTAESKSKNRKIADARAKTPSKIGSAELQEISKVVADQVETLQSLQEKFDTIPDMTEQAEVIEGLNTTVTEQAEVIEGLLEALKNMTGVLDTAVNDINELKEGETKVVTPEETKVVTPEETKVVTPEETKTTGDTPPRTRRNK